MLIFRRKLITVFKNIVMIIMISGVAVTKQIFSSVKEKCAVKEPEEFQNDGLQIHATHMKVNMKFYNSYFIFGGSQVS